MFNRELKRAFEEGIEVFLYIGGKFVNGMITDMDDHHVEVARISGHSKDTFVIKLSCVEYISVGHSETLNAKSLNEILDRTQSPQE